MQQDEDLYAEYQSNNKKKQKHVSTKYFNGSHRYRYYEKGSFSPKYVYANKKPSNSIFSLVFTIMIYSTIFENGILYLTKSIQYGNAYGSLMTAIVGIGFLLIYAIKSFPKMIRDYKKFSKFRGAVLDDDMKAKAFFNKPIKNITKEDLAMMDHKDLGKTLKRILKEGTQDRKIKQHNKQIDRAKKKYNRK